jgi:hypothetical protein
MVGSPTTIDTDKRAEQKLAEYGEPGEPNNNPTAQWLASFKCFIATVSEQRLT